MEISDILNSKTAASTLGDAGSEIKKNEIQGKFDRLLKKNIESRENGISASAPGGKKLTDKKLMNVCVEMESIFVSRMLSEMRKTLPKEKLVDGGFAEKIFEDMLYDEYALNLSKTSNLGIATMLYNDLSRK